jgi:hypothetical protein
MLPFRVNLAIQSESHSVPPPSSPRSLRALCVSALDFSSVLPVSRLASHQIPAAPLFSFTYKLPIFYPLCFDIHPCNGGGGTPLPTFQHTNAPLRPGNTSGTIHVFYFHILPHSFARWAQLNSFAINTFHTLSVAMGGYPPGAPFSRMAFCSARIGRFAFPGWQDVNVIAESTGGE